MKAVLAALVLLLLPVTAEAHRFPAGFHKYGKMCLKIHMNYFGQHWSTIPLAQIEQESGWRPAVCSAFACGLTQFTPATQRDMENRHGLRHTNINRSPKHACVLQNLYLRDLARTEGGVLSGFYNTWAWILRIYNGGKRWLVCEWAKCGKPNDYRLIEGCNCRAGWAHRENTEYPRKVFAKWGKYKEVFGR